MNDDIKKSDQVEFLKFPFIGTLEDGEPFEYLLIALHADFIEIAILEWFVNRTRLYTGSHVDLYIPEFLGRESQSLCSAGGIVGSIENNDEIRGKVCRIFLSKTIPFNANRGIYSFDAYISQLPIQISLIDLLVFLIKDSMLLKQGVVIYLRHLIAYFSRIVNYSYHDYAKLQKYFLSDIEKHVEDNESRLEKLYFLIKDKLNQVEKIPIYIDLEQIRGALESEISSPLFNVVFAQQLNSERKESFLTQTTDAFTIYIQAIKNLEKRLYLNYNQIVIAYLRGCSQT